MTRRRGDVTTPRRFSRHCPAVVATRDNDSMTEIPGRLSSHRGESAAIIPWRQLRASVKPISFYVEQYSVSLLFRDIFFLNLNLPTRLLKRIKMNKKKQR